MKNKWMIISLVLLSIGNATTTTLAQEPMYCVAPVNINYVVSPDKKQVTFAWQPYPASTPILYYQINDSANVPLWKSADTNDHCFSSRLTGLNGTFIYYFYSKCTTGFSAAYKFQVVVN